MTDQIAGLESAGLIWPIIFIILHMSGTAFSLALKWVDVLVYDTTLQHIKGYSANLWVRSVPHK